MSAEASLEWMALAACRYTDPELFFPVQFADAAARPAKLVCHGCPVRVECAEHAVGRPELGGVWGGLTELERRKVRRWRELNAGGTIPAGAS